MTSISGKVIAITGASSGIGRETALKLAGVGAKLVLGARKREALESLEEEITLMGGEAAFAITDVCVREDLQRLVDVACQRFGQLDVFISNAGIGPISMLDELRVDDWDAMIDVNLRGVIYGIAAALPIFRRQSSGHFVSVISTAGLKIVPGQAIYAGTKNAVRTIHEGLRQEAGPNLRVTGISPGIIRTSFGEAIPSQELRNKVADSMESIAIDPAAVASAIAFAIAQPPEVDIGDIVVRPTAQG
ncbi:SDR family oxidoreductase [Halomonas sp. IOP_14]|uniref:SDR family oxidoreductase n=1 Tax=Halomonas sp. IOP_14 TaxID=2873295 RepID=UPI001E529468|nr:SDR family oxidoreductase [Halomonas sp. IOP_14]MCD1587774.1 SDR family oxidoreductase [Halomonas sp. IOP_14]